MKHTAAGNTNLLVNNFIYLQKKLNTRNYTSYIGPLRTFSNMNLWIVKSYFEIMIQLLISYLVCRIPIVSLVFEQSINNNIIFVTYLKRRLPHNLYSSKTRNVFRWFSRMFQTSSFLQCFIYHLIFLTNLISRVKVVFTLQRSLNNKYLNNA